MNTGDDHRVRHLRFAGLKPFGFGQVEGDVEGVLWVASRLTSERTANTIIRYEV